MRAGQRCRSLAARAVAAEADVVEGKLRSPPSHEGIRVSFQSGQISAVGCRPMLEDVNAEVFVSRSSDEALILGLESGNGASSMHDIALGKLQCRRFLACARCKLWWMTPEWGSAAEEIPPETQFLLLELAEGGPYAILLPLIDSNTFRATLRPHRFSEPASRVRDVEEKLHLRIESGDPTVLGERWSQALYVAAGWEPYALVDRAVAAAASLSGSAKPREEKALPPSLDVFGWCTWDAFYSRVSARGLHIGLQSLVSGGIPPRLLIIDDGWQSTDVDAEFRQTVSDKLRLSEPMPQLDETQPEFIEAELEMLAKMTRDLPAGSTLGVALEALSADEENMSHYNRTNSNPDMPWRKSMQERRRKKAQENGRIDYEAEPDDSWGSTEDSDRSLEASAAERNSGEASISGRQLPEADARALARADAGRLTQSDKDRLISAAGLTSTTSLEESSSSNQPQMPIMWLVSAIAQRFVGLFVGLMQAIIVRIYQYIVDPAPPDSLPNKMFALLAAGPLRGTILEFLSTSGDFTRRLSGIEANSKFSSPLAGPLDYFSGRPAQLGEVVRSLKQRFDLSYVYCWHGLPAYWSGVATPEDAPRMAKYGSRLVRATPTRGLYEIEPSAAWNPAVIGGVGVPRDVRELYGDMHEYLANAGVTGVKVDCQAGVGLAGSALGGGASLAAEYHTALEDSVAQHFSDNHVINCMCHSTENLYRMRDTAVVRASDDFYPRNEASSHPHVAACAFNSVFIGALAQPDWDMFHSLHPAALLHATARALSGGAIYVSDYPGRHGFDILRKLVLPDGSTLRAQHPGRPTRDTLFKDVLRDDASLLKVFNMNAYSGIVGIFHLQGSSWDRKRRQFVTHDASPRALEVEVRPTDVDTFARNVRHPTAQWPADEDLPTSWAAHLSATDEITRLRADDSIPIRLDGGGSAVVTFAPILESGSISFAALGLTEMLNGGGAVLSCSLQRRPAQSSGMNGSKSRGRFTDSSSSTITGEVRVRGCGKFTMFVSEMPAGCLVDSEPLDFKFEADNGRLTIEMPQTESLQHDVEVVF